MLQASSDDSIEPFGERRFERNEVVEGTPPISRGDMTNSKQVADDEALMETACSHHWALSSPKGPISHSVCRNCGEEHDFPNYIE